MCGIVGAIYDDDDSGVLLSADAARAALWPRGPDAWGVIHEPGVFLGHARLAIIDISDAASQPMQSACGRYCIVFNGEVYNFRELRKAFDPDFPWTSQSDTEVVLEAFARWGVGCLSRLHGMFAFAVWDRRERKLTLARDRLGVKPLYYAQDGGAFAFASRPGALLGLLPRMNRSINRQAVRLYLEAGYVPAPEAYHAKLRKLCPGQYLELAGARVALSTYWSLDGVETDSRLSRVPEAEMLEELDELVDRSVRWRMVSDVPIGAFLSGGIDSSLVAALMARHSTQPIRTFTIGFDDPTFDESAHAKAVASHLGAEHACEVLHADDLLELMPDFLKHYDEPFFDYSAFPLMAVSRLAARSVKVSLSGDGGDEAFGGYHYYRIAHVLAPFLGLPAWMRRGAGMAMKRVPGKARLLGHAVQMPSAAAAFAFSRSVIKDAGAILAPSLVADTHSMVDLFIARAENFPEGMGAAEMAMRLDAAYTLPDDYLQKVDVGSMAFSLEARDPLLDHSIFEWAARLPMNWKIRGSTNKYLLRKLAYRYVPREILDRPKMGFGVPMARWLREGLRKWGEDLLTESTTMRELELVPEAVRDLWRTHQEGRRDVHSALWAILVLVHFQRSCETPVP